MSDHQDAHLAKLHPECDIGDFWVYHHGRGLDARVVFVMTLNAGNVGLVHYGPRGNRNEALYTTVPKRFLAHVPDRGLVRSKGLLAPGDHRRDLTARLRFHPDAVYEFRIAKPDGSALRPVMSYKIIFDGEGGIPDGMDEPQPQRVQLLRAETELGDHVERGDRSGTEVALTGDVRTYTASDPQDPANVPGFAGTTDAGVIQLFAGPRQDPFTFDFEGVRTPLAHQYRKELCAGGGPSGGSSDAFSRAFNISAIVLEVPIQDILTTAEIESGMSFAAWSATTLEGHPINRAGWPLFKPTFLPKEYFEGIIDPTNGTKLERQQAVLTPLLREELDRLGASSHTSDALVQMVVPDALAVDVSREPGLTQSPPNGRTLDASGDPARFFVTALDPEAYDERSSPTGRPPALRPLEQFPYLTAPAAAPGSTGSAGWTDYVPIPDPPWPSPTPTWNEPSSADDYLDGLLDPSVRHPSPRPRRSA